MEAQVVDLTNDSFDLFGDDFDKEEIEYTTVYFNLGVYLPMGSGSRFGGPIIQVLFLPTPDEIDESTVTIITAGFKHVW